MKRIIYIYSIIALALGMASCSTEAPFSAESRKGEGRVLASALSVELKTDEKLVRSSGVPDVSDFTVDFIKADNLEDSPVKHFRYGDMPEVVTLPVGEYVARAYYGGDYGSEGGKAAFSAPYYLGESGRFTISENKITDNIGTVECRLSNVKVTILFDENLVKVMSPDSKVSVSVGQRGSLDFTPSTSESGYFAYEEGSNTISAVFTGVVDGDEVTESKSYSNVKAGNHYRITFKLHSVDPNEPGDINPGNPGDEIKIDATVSLEDMTGGGGTDVGEPSDEDIYMDDDRYPNEDPGNDPGPDDPSTPENGPKVTAEAPIDLDKVNEVNASSKVVLNFESKADSGFTTFEVDIESNDLTPAELEGVGLGAHLDLINPGELLGALQGLGILKENQETVLGEKNVVFDISQFMTPLSMFSGEHHFVIKVADSDGEKVVTLKLKV